MMKQKWRLVFVCAALFVIIVSFKILEPELFRDGNVELGVYNDKEPHNDYEKGNKDDLNFKDKELPGNERKEEEDVDAEEDNIDLRHNGDLTDGHKQDTLHHVQVDEVVRAMTKRFSLDWNYTLSSSPWNVAASWVTPRQIHPENAKELGAILRAMHEGNITKADVGVKGTQLKLMLLLNNEQKVVFKPAWYQRDYVVTGAPYAGRDRHNAEIAAFHIGRILELRRTPLVVGRRLNLHKDILPVATGRLKHTFFEKEGEPCFYGRCLYCKGPEDGVCAVDGGVLEGTLVLWLPTHYQLKLHRHPWGRTYREGRLAKWETDETYCAQIRTSPGYRQGTRLLDLVDTAVLDFLVGNADRHHYETIEEGGNDAAVVILDNGKSFGNPDHDEMSILAPLYQCCQIRSRLWQRLLSLQDGVLSRVLHGVLAQDPIAPVLEKTHLKALDRRLEKVLHQVSACVDRVGITAIVVGDELGDDKDKR